MKTKEELLKFYGIEEGKKYKVTGASANSSRLINATFSYNELEKNYTTISVYNNDCRFGCIKIHILSELDYEEVKEPILDAKERKYLSAVIKPFKKQVQWVKKFPYFTSENKYEYIRINCKELDGSILVFDFPMFKKGTMYENMETSKEYTLKELDL